MKPEFSVQFRKLSVNLVQDILQLSSELAGKLRIIRGNVGSLLPGFRSVNKPYRPPGPEGIAITDSIFLICEVFSVDDLGIIRKLRFALMTDEQPAGSHVIGQPAYIAELIHTFSEADAGFLGDSPRVAVPATEVRYCLDIAHHQRKFFRNSFRASKTYRWNFLFPTTGRRRFPSLHTVSRVSKCDTCLPVLYQIDTIFRYRLRRRLYNTPLSRPAATKWSQTWKRAFSVAVVSGGWAGEFYKTISSILTGGGRRTGHASQEPILR